MKSKKSITAFLGIVSLALIIFSISSCEKSNETFTETEQETLLSSSGNEYAFLANEGILHYFGELEFLGGVEDEIKKENPLGPSYQNGLYAIQGNKTKNILIRRLPDNEWYAIYRKADLPEFDFSVDNCDRLEFISGPDWPRDEAHVTCGDGITDKAEIQEFLAEIRTQPTPEEAGLYGLIKKENGSLENCYTCASVYAFFDEEPYLAKIMEVWSYNDLAYSISIGEKDYVLPEKWLEKLKQN